jgi:hypothetical protein
MPPNVGSQGTEVREFICRVMSVLGQSLPKWVVRDMSDLAPIATEERRGTSKRCHSSETCWSRRSLMQVNNDSFVDNNLIK